MRSLEKFLLLRSIDGLWIEHLEAIEHLRTGIGLRGYGQREPLVEYKRESFELFQLLLDLISEQVTHSIFKIGLASQLAMPNEPRQAQAREIKSNVNQFGQMNTGQSNEKPSLSAKTKNEFGEKVGRNDPCPCGSGLKYKKCHGK